MMIKKLLIAFTLLTALIPVTSVAAATTPLSAAEQRQVIDKINAAASKMTTMTCSFVQTKQLSLLNDNMVSRGQMTYKQPDKLRWEYTSPYSYTFTFNGTKVYVGGKGRKDVIDTTQNKIFKEVARIMMSTVTGKALSNPADFTVSVTATDSAWDVTLVPRKKEMKQMFSKIILTFSKSRMMINEINIFEKNGDRTSIKLNDIVTNGTVKTNTFDIP